MVQHVLEGEVEDPKARKIAALEVELRQVRRELADAQLEADRAREDGRWRINGVFLP